MNRPALRRLVAFLVIGVACSRRSSAPSVQAVAAGEVARVGGVGVPASLVAEVARAQGVTARSALGELIEDALTSEAARALSLADDPKVRFACVAARARTVPLRVAVAAREAGRPRDEEVATLTVVHALVRRTRGISARAGLALANLIHQSVEGSSSPEEFETRASAVPHAGAQVRIERVLGFAADGKLDNGGVIDPSFVAAAFALASTATTSPVVETPFGWHVLRLVDRVVPAADTIEQRRRELNEAVVSMRARLALDTILRERRQRTDVSIAAEADALTLRVTSSQP